MLCASPHRQGVLEFGCGQCMPCRINKRRLWTARLMMESYCHAHSAFVTLTYNDEHLPAGGSLSPADLRDFLKRLRYFHTKPIRYFAVGEYGDETQRAHYHLIVFGLEELTLEYNAKKTGMAFRSKAIGEAWGDRGFYTVRSFTPSAAEYAAGYCLKKLDKADDPRYLTDGRHSEFTRMSRKPGLGYYFAKEIAKQQTSLAGSQFFTSTGDVFKEWRLEGRKWPIGYYLRSILREESGYPRPTPPYMKERIRLAKLMEYATPEQLEERERHRKESAFKAIRKVFKSSQRRPL